VNRILDEILATCTLICVQGNTQKVQGNASGPFVLTFSQVLAFNSLYLVQPK